VFSKGGALCAPPFCFPTIGKLRFTFRPGITPKEAAAVEAAAEQSGEAMSEKKPMQIFQCLEKRLKAAGNGNPKRSVEELAAHVLGCRPLEIYFRGMSAGQAAELEMLTARAELGEPIQYIIGHVDFRGLEITCDPRALIPRPETELLVDAVLSSVANRQSAIGIVDVCTGTGCIGLALAHELPGAQVTAIDISPDALALARENAQRLGLADRVTFVQGDLLNADAVFFAENSFDIIVSNPPYILSDVCKALDASVREHEPMLALDGGGDGLDLIRPLAGQAARVLKPAGSLFLEIGHDQGRETSCTLKAAGFENVRIVKDLAGLDRIVGGVRPSGDGRPYIPRRDQKAL
jgi:release factor glutamine methyltransferase